MPDFLDKVFDSGYCKVSVIVPFHSFIYSFIQQIFIEYSSCDKYCAKQQCSYEQDRPGLDTDEKTEGQRSDVTDPRSEQAAGRVGLAAVFVAGELCSSHLPVQQSGQRGTWTLSSQDLGFEEEALLWFLHSQSFLQGCPSLSRNIVHQLLQAWGFMRVAPRPETPGLETARQGLCLGSPEPPRYCSVSPHLWGHPRPPPLPHWGFRLAAL